VTALLLVGSVDILDGLIVALVRLALVALGVVLLVLVTAGLLLAVVTVVLSRRRGREWTDDPDPPD
jgi:hypothetical protein